MPTLTVLISSRAGLAARLVGNASDTNCTECRWHYAAGGRSSIGCNEIANIADRLGRR